MFPITGRYKRSLNIEINKDVFELIKNKISEDFGTKYLKFTAEENSLKITPPFGSGMYSDFYCIYKAEFTFNTSDNISTIEYNYIVGNDFYIALAVFTLPVIASLTNAIPYKHSHFIFYWCSAFFLVNWLAIVKNQYFLFRGIIKKIKATYTA